MREQQRQRQRQKKRETQLVMNMLVDDPMAVMRDLMRGPLLPMPPFLWDNGMDDNKVASPQVDQFNVTRLSGPEGDVVYEFFTS